MHADIGPVQGSCDVAFARVREVMSELFAAGQDSGAAFTVIVDGETVIDIWGGYARA